MEGLKQLLPLIISGSLGALVLSVGLDATLRDLVYFWRHPLALIRAFIAVSVIVPAVAMVVTGLFPLHPISRVGILLMALAPVPPLVPGKSLKLGGAKGYVYGLYVTFACLAVVIVPVSLAVMSRFYGKDATIPAAAIARVVLASVLAPLVVGLMIQGVWPRLATKAAPIVSKLSLLLLVVILIPLVITAWPAMRQLIGDGTVVSIILIVVAGLVGGHVLGGPLWQDRVALAGAAATRHPGIALLIADANFADKQVTAVVVLFLLVGIAVMIPYQQWVNRAHPDKPSRPLQTT